MVRWGNLSSKIKIKIILSSVKGSVVKRKLLKSALAIFDKFLNKIRFYFLQSTEDDGADGRDPLWGRFPLEQHYKKYQVPHPFVNGQDANFAM